MKTRTRIAAIGIAVAALGTTGGLAATSASAGVNPSPSGDCQSLYTSDCPTPTPTPTVPVPVPFNRFAHCRFTLTRETTFAPQLGRFVTGFDPSITCITRFGQVQVYTLGPGTF
jgi:hypothetical protein